MSSYSNLLIGFCSALLCSVTTFLFSCKGGLSADVPNQRSSHVQVTPRGGGVTIGVCTLFMFAIFWSFGEIDASFSTVALTVAITGMFLLGICEDRWGVSARLRLALEFTFATVVALAGFRLQQLSFPGLTLELGIVLSFVLTLLFIVWMTNLYNFMDGLNGIATGQAIVATVFYYIVAIDIGHQPLALLLLVLLGALLGFLPLNFPRAKIFLGDAGSLTFGFLFAVLPIYLQYQAPRFNVVLGILPLLVFCIDATLTLIKRIVRGERLALAHRTHYYQRLAKRDGNKHWRVTMVFTSLSACFCCSALEFYFADAVRAWWILGITGLVLVGLFIAIDLLELLQGEMNSVEKGVSIDNKS